MSYDATALAPINPRNVDCAAAWVGFWLRGSDALGLDEITANLLLDSVVDPVGRVTYYRPHLTASRLLLGDQAVLAAYRLGDVTETYRNPQDIANAFMQAGTAFDTLIPVGLIDSSGASFGRSVF